MINITKRGWNHIIKYHTASQWPTHANKSKFNAGEDLIELINQASLQQPTTTKRQHIVRTFDAGHNIGTDRHSKKATSVVTVITRLNGDLVNMFPGPP